MQLKHCGTIAADPLETIRSPLVTQIRCNMQKSFARIWSEETGVLSFEWILLVTLLTIGIVSGLSAARDGIIDELADVASASTAIDQSFSLSGQTILGTVNGVPNQVVFTSAASTYTDAAAPVTRCDRGVAGSITNQAPSLDSAGGG